MTDYGFVAVDLGAESGRVIAGAFDGRALRLSEVHRFDNVPLQLGEHLHWDSRQLMSDIRHGLELLGSSGTEVRSIAVDSWGVDYGLLDAEGALIAEPSHYRDSRTDGMSERIARIVPQGDLFAVTGVQPSDINTLCQLYSMVCCEDAALKQARRLVMMPDLVNFFLSGVATNEFTIATTSQCLDMAKRTWALPLLERLNIPATLFGQLVVPGTVIGRLAAPYKDISSMAATDVVASACHDTASAVAAIPAFGDDFAYISSGTWSLMGVSSNAPVVTPAALRLGFTNEGAADGRVRVLKNITGLWLLRQCRKSWAARGVDVDYESIVRSAQASPDAEHVFDPDHGSLKNPVDMESAIMRLCPGASPDVGGLARTIFQSLACKYRHTLDQLQLVTGRRPSRLQVVGGGSKNPLLCQLTADACGVEVSAGPAESTALGNVLGQLIACGECSNWSEAREVVRRSFQPAVYLPRHDPRWDELLAKLDGVTV
jgi:rhamnulokinase